MAFLDDLQLMFYIDQLMFKHTMDIFYCILTVGGSSKPMLWTGKNLKSQFPILFIL